MDDSLPAPLVAPEVDLRDIPIPRDYFAQLAVLEFGVSIEETRAFVDRVADRMEGVAVEEAKLRRKSSRRSRRRSC